MATVANFEELKVWQQARAFSQAVYHLTQEETFSRDWGLKRQINDSSGSIMDNIAEGFERGGNKEFVTFLSYAKGSAGETRSQLYRALDRGYISTASFDTLRDEVVVIAKRISALMDYLKASDYKGNKFKKTRE